MIPTKQEIIDLIKTSERAKTHPDWVTHSIGVGNTAGKIAAAINQATAKDLLDAEEIIKMGYLHDIGKMVGSAELHPLNGYKYLQEQGYPEEYSVISLTHSFVNNDPFCMFSDFMQPERDREVIEFIQKHQFNLAEKIISLSDILFGVEPMTIEKRVVDIIIRHGAGKKLRERMEAVYSIKNEIDDLLGYNLYDLFPEIEENL